MRKFLVIFFLALSLQTVPANAQARPDSVTIGRVELDRFFASVDSLQSQNKLYQELIRNYNLRIENYRYIRQQDSLLVSYKDRRIVLLQEEIQIHEARIKRLEKSNWKTGMLVLSGAAAILVSSIVLDNIGGTTRF